MAGRKKTYEPLATIGPVHDELGAILPSIRATLDPPARTGRPRTDERAARNGIIDQRRRGGQWNQLPAPFGDDSCVHRPMPRWIAQGVFERLGAVLVENGQELGGGNGQGQSADGAWARRVGGG